MEENVALDSSKQKQFVKSVKGIKKLIKKNVAKATDDKVSEETPSTKKGKKSTRKPRGLVYLGHIPHGFYEHEMTQYFKQFGVVTNARVIRSKRTGGSKGYAFVEFKDPAVAEIVAETMNNYLMGKRLIKAEYIPPEKQRRNAKRKNWNSTFNPGREATLKLRKNYNATKTDSEVLERAKKLLTSFRKTKKKLTEMGINYDFFTPVDIPKELSLNPPTKGKSDKSVVNTNEVDKSKPAKKEKKEGKEIKVEINDKITKNNKVKPTNQKEKESKAGKKVHIKTVDSKEQKQKEQKLKDAGVEHLGNFIRIKQANDSDAESNSSYEFDSDEFEKMLQNETNGSDVSTGEESEGAEDSDNEEDSEDNEDEESNEDESEEEEEIVPQKKKPLVVPPKKEVKAPKSKPQVKRKANQASPAVSSKKSKFENKNTKNLAKKQFKKKK